MKLIIQLREQVSAKLCADILKFFRRHRKSAQATRSGQCVTLEFDIDFPVLWSGARFDNPILARELILYKKQLGQWLIEKRIQYVSIEYCP